MINHLSQFDVFFRSPPRSETFSQLIKNNGAVNRSTLVAIVLVLSAFLSSSVFALPDPLQPAKVAEQNIDVSRAANITNLRAEVYSGTALELFWDRVQGGPIVIEHKVYMSNQLVSSRDGYSYFVSGLSAGQAYQFRVEAVSAGGAILASQSITVKTKGDALPQNEGTPSNPSGSAPHNFRYTIYSRTVAELFWDAVPGETVIRYELHLNGVFKISTHGRSFFIPHYDPDSLYVYELYAVNAVGMRSEPTSLSLGSDGASSPPVPTDSSNVNYLATVEHDRYTLSEGGGELSIPITVRRQSGHNRPLRLMLDSSGSSALDQLDYQFEPAVIGGSNTLSTLRLSLKVAMAPIKPQRHAVIISLDDGDALQRLGVDLDIAPIQAPDVYLLAGQSNMEGSSLRGEKDADIGGLDTPDERILQLNVMQNNTSVFSEPWMFASEQANVSSPLLIPAEDPLHQPRWPGIDTKGGTAIGLGLSFAKSILGHTNQKVVLVPAAWSGAGFCDNGDAAVNWNAAETGNSALGGSLLLDRALVRLNLALKNTGGIFRGILWHQGEADSNNPGCAVSYRDNLARMVARIRREAVPDRRGSEARGSDAAIPFIAGTMSRAGDFAWFGEIKDQVDAAHRGISDFIPWSDYVNNDDLVPPAYPCGSGSCVHFGASALRIMGARYGGALHRITAR